MQFLKISRLFLLDKIFCFGELGLRKLSLPVQQALQLAACIGNVFDLKTLSVINKSSMDQTNEELLEAMKQGMIVPLGDDYKFVFGDRGSDVGDRGSGNRNLEPHQGDDTNEVLSGIGSMTESRRSSDGNISDNETISKRGNLRFHVADEEGGRFNSVEHSGRMGERDEGIYAVSQDIQRFSDGVGNANDNFAEVELSEGGEAQDAARRDNDNRKNAQRSDQESVKTSLIAKSGTGTQGLGNGSRGFQAPGTGVRIPETDPQFLTPEYKFQHDRVQQAAYALIDEDKKQEVHLSIGRLIRQSATENEMEEKLADIVRHLNEGRSLIIEEREREELARLNLQGRDKSQKLHRYQPAL